MVNKCRCVLFLPLVLVLSCCATFPSKQLAFDFSAEKMPVMLSAASVGATVRTLEFESGYMKKSVTTTTRVGAATASSTATVAQNLNKPLGEQVRNTLLQEPAWLTVSGLALRTRILESLALSTHEYVVALQIQAPVGAGKE